MTEARVFGGRWRVLDRCGKGGQGIVYKVADISGTPAPAQQATELKIALRDVTAVGQHMDTEQHTFERLLEVLRATVNPPPLPVAAVKELLPFEDAMAADENTALARMKNEIETLRTTEHPALLKVFDSHVDQRWFAMEFFEKGPMSKHPARFKGKALDSLRALRPIVEAVAELHKKKVVHRDIKPDNIFVADDEHLVLGDCGLAFKMADQDRLTLSFENVGTRDYQPPWTYSARVEDVKPNFDVFGLAKVLWSMISGRPRFPLHNFTKPANDLRVMFPTDAGVEFVHRIFKNCIVLEEEDCVIPDATELLVEFDIAIRAIEAGGTLPTTKRRTICHFCGIGRYHESSNYEATGSNDSKTNKYFVCDQCGHIQVFAFKHGNPPPAWSNA